jgi:hypothetical protein
LAFDIVRPFWPAMPTAQAQSSRDGPAK